MLWQTDLLFVLCAFFTVFFLAKWINQRTQIRNYYGQFAAYFSSVVDNSLENKPCQEVIPLLTHLNNCSQKMQSWYEQTCTETDNSSSEDDGESFFEKYKPLKKSKGFRTIGLQTESNNDFHTPLKYSQNPWRTSQFYSFGNKSDKPFENCKMSN